MTLEDFMLNEINQVQKCKYHWSHLYVESKNIDFIQDEVEQWLLPVSGGEDRAVLAGGKVGQRIQNYT
jgi:hypothetical protein